MAFSFGAATPSPAPAGASGGFSFGSSSTSGAPAPAPSSGFSFGGTTSSNTPAPASSSFAGFGGTAPAPAPGAFFFASSSSAPAAPPSTGFSFGSTAPAPSAFGQPTGTSTTSIFGGGGGGGAPSSSGFGGGLFGTQTQQQSAFGFGSQQQQQQQQQSLLGPVVSGNMFYSALPDQYKRDIDAMYNLIRNHQRTMEHVKSMAPHQLVAVSTTDNNDDAVQDAPLTKHQKQVQTTLETVHQSMSKLQSQIQSLQGKSNELAKQVLLHAKWPLETVGIRRGIRLAIEQHDRDEKKTTDCGPDDTAATSSSSSSSTLAKVQQLLDSQLQYVDRIERMPSPYLVQALAEWQQRAHALETQVQQQLAQLDAARSIDDDGYAAMIPIESLVRMQHQVLVQHALRLAQLKNDIDAIRYQYRQYERGENVVDKAELEEFEQEQRWNEQVLLKFVEQQQTSSTQQGQPSSQSGAPSSTAGFGFGSSTSAPAPGGFASSFGGTTATPAPAPGLFGFSSAPSTAPPSTSTPGTASSLFSSTSAAPTATTAAPGASSFSFASTTPPPPATSFSFTSPPSGSSSSSSKSSKKPSRSSGRLRK